MGGGEAEMGWQWFLSHLHQSLLWILVPRTQHSLNMATMDYTFEYAIQYIRNSVPLSHSKVMLSDIPLELTKAYIIFLAALVLSFRYCPCNVVCQLTLTKNMIVFLNLFAGRCKEKFKPAIASVLELFMIFSCS